MDSTRQWALDPPAPFPPMAFDSPKDSRILNVTRNCRLKLHQAEARIKAGVADWVERGVSIREFALCELLEAREQQRIFGKSNRCNGLEPCEVHGCKYVGPKAKEGFELVAQARQFYNAAIL